MNTSGHRYDMVGRKLLLVVVGAFVLTGMGGAPGVSAAPAPAGTVTLYGDRSLCRNAQLPRDNVACAVALTREWLDHTGRSTAVRRTVAVSNPALGGSWNPQNRDVCVYAEVGTVLNLGLHHCNTITFVNWVTDAALIRTPARALTTFVHESSHGVQEAIGLKPVSVTVLGPADALRRLEWASDCWSGAAWSWFVRSGEMTAAERDEATAFMYSLPERTSHGSGSERGAAFERGIVEGVTACDQILGTPAYT
ncbi:hypothetical protein [Gordonia tangerina]|uniref:Metalloprotease n=1 Tax=Gordonia tangerina TaxID=2911060 RepID=A0ABS9DGD5_9ACTN|nr:hypothetical protein [Gordonia tangerina]MCF3938285.1 hypothetical protein [Gordonia tangerina]